LQNGTHRRKGGAADQLTHRRMGLGTARKVETSVMKNVSIERSGGKMFMTLGSGNLCIHRKFPLIIK
jgi:hypothetical protein